MNCSIIKVICLIVDFLINELENYKIKGEIPVIKRFAVNYNNHFYRVRFFGSRALSRWYISSVTK